MSVPLIKEIIERLAGIEVDDLRYEPGEAVQDGDHVLGVMNDELKKFNVLRNETLRETQEIALKIVAIEDKTGDKEHPDIAKLRPDFDLASVKHHAAESLFWDSLRVEFPGTLSKPSIALRKGWQVVWNEEGRRITRIGVIISPVFPEELGFSAGPQKKDILH